MRILLLLVLASFGLVAAQQTIVCYFGSWAFWRPGDGKFDVDDIDPFLCTHYIFGFAGLSNYTWTIEVLDPWYELCPSEQDGHYCAYERFVALKEINPALKIILAVGGWNEGSVDYSTMAMDPAKRKKFIDSSVALVRKYGFDGLDVDWEYPAARGGVPEDKENFVILMEEFRAAFDMYNPPLLLTSAFSPGKPTIDLAYDVPRLVNSFDQFHVMGYDYHGAWHNFTHHNAPLCGYYLDWGEYVWFNVDFTVRYYIDLGVPLEKLVVGIPTYGRCWVLDDINDHGMLAPAQEPGLPGPYTRLSGTLGANEICKKLQEQDCNIVHDPALNEPYFFCYDDNVWCGYDDADSVYLKARYARDMGTAGVMVWTIDTDDFRANCYPDKFHLIRSMKRALSIDPDPEPQTCNPITPTMDFSTTPIPTEPPTPEPTPTLPTEPPTPEPTPTLPTEPPTPEPTPTLPTEPPTPEPTGTLPIGPTTPGPPGSRPDCTNIADGTTFPHFDCNKYWKCINQNAILEPCAPGTLYDPNLTICNWEDNVNTDNCQLWICEIDNTYYPHEDCDKYYWCYHGSPNLEQCPPGTYWNQALQICDNPSDVDTSRCNPV